MQQQSVSESDRLIFISLNNSSWWIIVAVEGEVCVQMTRKTDSMRDGSENKKDRAYGNIEHYVMEKKYWQTHAEPLMTVYRLAAELRLTWCCQAVVF